MTHNWVISRTVYDCRANEGRFIEGPENSLFATHEPNRSDSDVEGFSVVAASSSVIFPSYPFRIHDVFPNIQFVQLVDVGLTSVGYGQLRNLLQISLTRDRIEAIDAGIFELSPELIEINFSIQRIREVNKEAFRGLTKIDIINLSDNLLTSLDPETFHYTPSLTTLSLNSNRLTAFAAFTMPLINLINLSLATNLIRDIPPNAFDHMRNLETIGLGANLLVDFDGELVRNFPNLFWLHLGFNMLKNISLPIRSARFLSLQGNLLTSINENFLPADSIVHMLWLNNNQISKIHPNFLNTLLIPEVDLWENVCISGTFRIIPENLAQNLPRFEPCFN